MFVDASALVAVLLKETDYPLFAAALEKSDASRITPFVLMEIGLAAMRETQRRADEIHSDTDAMLRHFRIQTVELTPDMILAALQAYELYGKGRKHTAQLNMGDCLSYGAAKVLNVPLLFKGDDFARTDIRSALR